ncbi:MAG: pilin [Clostridia bacterium]|nr:pilin [Clostridia bacterium]
MKNIHIKKLFIIVTIIILLILICMPKSFGAVKPSDLTGEIQGNDTINLDFVDKLADMLRLMGTFLAVGVLMVIGIKYISGSIEEKAAYKKTMIPYAIGCILLFGAGAIAPMIIEIFKDAEGAEDIGNVALGLVQVIGTFLAVGVLMILGIKYMVGSAEERASYKKSMLPYIVGAILLFGAVNLTAVVVNMTSEALEGKFKLVCTKACGFTITVTPDEYNSNLRCPSCSARLKKSK